MAFRVETQLGDLEQKVAQADDGTKQLLGAGTQILMGLPSSSEDTTEPTKDESKQ